MLKKFAIAAAAIAVMAGSVQAAEARGPGYYHGYWGGHYGRWNGGCWGCGAFLPIITFGAGMAVERALNPPPTVIYQQPVILQPQQPVYVGPAISDGPAPNCFNRQYGYDMQNRPLYERVCR